MSADKHGFVWLKSHWLPFRVFEVNDQQCCLGLVAIPWEVGCTSPHTRIITAVYSLYMGDPMDDHGPN